jgi:hypothetical protein
MEAAGTWPSETLRARLSREEWLKTVGNPHSLCDEFAEEVFCALIGQWVRQHKKALHHVESESHGYRVCLDFVHEADRDLFLAEHPNWQNLPIRVFISRLAEGVYANRLSWVDDEDPGWSTLSSED